jgi:azurin
MKIAKSLLVAACSAVLLIGCGGKEEKKKKGFSYEKKTDVVKEVKSNPNEVVITGNDAMKFNKTEIKVKAGEKVKITLKHIGKMDKKVMGHNFVLLKKGVSVTAFGNKAATASSTQYIPDNGKDIIAHTDIVGAGETSIVEFDAPEPGVYDFLCSFPGHYLMMKGKFIVE